MSAGQFTYSPTDDGYTYLDDPRFRAVPLAERGPRGNIHYGLRFFGLPVTYGCDNGAGMSLETAARRIAGLSARMVA